MSEHRVRLDQRGDEPLQPHRGQLHGAGQRRHLFACVGQEFVERGVEQADGDGIGRHRFEQPLKIRALHRQQLRQRTAATGLVRSDDHLSHRGDAIALEEHVLGAAQPDSFGAERAAPLRVRRRIGVGAHPQPAALVRPGHELGVVGPELRLHQLGCAEQNSPRGAVDREHLSFLHDAPVRPEPALLRVDLDILRPHDARLPHPAGDDRRMARHAAARGQHRACCDDPVEVLGARLRADQDDVAPAFRQGFGLVGVENDLPHRGARGRG